MSVLLLEGFEETVLVADIMSSRKWKEYIPSEKGVYAIISPDGFIPKFVNPGTGGYYKVRNPNVDIDELKENWVDNANILYIGKAGGTNQKTTLKNRVSLFILFGLTYPKPHWGGRYIWQLANVAQLHLAWKICDEEEPVVLKRKLINQFSNEYGKLPFANLV